MATGKTTRHGAVSGHSRRTLLRAGVLVTLGGTVTSLTGCDLFDRDEGPPPPDPLAPLLDEAVQLALVYGGTATAYPELAGRLNPIAEAHRAHATELAALIGVAVPSPTVAPPGSGNEPDQALAALRDWERSGRESATRACQSAPADRAALVASIVAARATHLEALK